MNRSIAILALLLAPLLALAQPKPTHPLPPGAAVASAHQLATDAGIEMLRHGGTAFDAAVAVSSVLSVVEPISSGLGGGGFFLLHDARSGQDVFVDARETAPKAATPARYLAADGEFDRDRAENGPWAAGIPGLPAALVHVAGKYGRLPLAKSLAPAIRIAREGFPVYARFANGYMQRREVMERYPGTREVFLRNGRAPQEGDLFRQPELAATLERLASGGHDGFYRGTTAERLLAGVAAAGGAWTAEELAAYQVKERAPLAFDYDGWRVVTAPPPSSGGVALAEMLQILAPWDLKALPEAEHLCMSMAQAAGLSAVPHALIRCGINTLPTLGDGRQSGTADSPSILNASPESAVGGGLSWLQSGDTVRIDLNTGRCDTLVAPEEIARRKRELPAPPVPASQSPWEALYREKTGQLADGATLDFALEFQRISEKTPRHNH